MYQNIFIESGEGLGKGMVHLWDDKQGYMTVPFSKFDYAYKPNSKGKYISMTGVRLEKVNKYRWEDKNLYESDLPRETRVLTDLYLNDDDPSEGHRVLYFDIEVSMENGVPNIQVPNNEITSIACYDEAIKEFYVFVLDKSGKARVSNRKDCTVSFHHSEIDLLYAFLDKYEEINPTIITGWNSDGFDIPYLINRLRQQCGANSAGRLSPIGKIKYSKFKGKYQIAGVSSLDYLILYKKFTFGDRPNYRLDTIGRLEVDMGKVEYEGNLDELYKTDLDKFIEYNLQDVRILIELDRAKKYIDLARNICHLGHVPYEDFFYSSKFLEGTIVTHLHRKGIIVTNKPEGGRELMDAREEDGDDDDAGFAGAYVKPPMPGLYEWVYSLDLQSLYPSIIMSLNISPETKVGFITNWDVKKHLEGKMKTYNFKVSDEETETQLNREQFTKLMNDSKYKISSNGVLYDGTKTGIIPEILNLWFDKRIEYKNLNKKYEKEGNSTLAEFYDQRQYIQKVFLNSLYGVLGLPIFRFFDIDNALAVTASGQDVIKTSAKFLSSIYEKKGAKPKSDTELHNYREDLKKYDKLSREEINELLDPNDHCIYIDTDSLYFSSKLLNNGQDDKEFTIKLAKAAEKSLNKFYDSLARDNFFCDEHRFVIKGEIVADTAIWLAKKRYAMHVTYSLEHNADRGGELKVKGLDTVRSSFPPAFRDFMKKMMQMVLTKTPKDEVDEFVLDFRKKLNSFPVEEVAKNTSVKNITKWDKNSDIYNDFMKKTPAAVKASITYNQFIKLNGLDKKFSPIEDGEKIKWVYLKTNPYNFSTIALKGYRDPNEIKKLASEYIDYNLLFKKELENKIEDFYSAMKWGNIPTKVNQKASKFFDF